MITTFERKSMNTPEEVRSFTNGKVELVKVGDFTFGRATLKPGWKWSNDVKPIAKTELCQSAHTHYQISGRLLVRMQDGTEHEFVPGDVAVIPPGHDAWVLGNEPVVVLDITGMKEYAKPK